MEVQVRDLKWLMMTSSISLSQEPHQLLFPAASPHTHTHGLVPEYDLRCAWKSLKQSMENEEAFALPTSGAYSPQSIPGTRIVVDYLCYHMVWSNQIGLGDWAHNEDSGNETRTAHTLTGSLRFF